MRGLRWIYEAVFSKHRRNRQNKPAYAASGILRRGIVGTYFNGFRAKLRVLSDRHILIQKRASRRQDAAICDIARYTFRLLGIKQLFLRRFCRKRHPAQSRQRTDISYFCEQREPIWLDIVFHSHLDVYEHACRDFA